MIRSGSSRRSLFATPREMVDEKGDVRWAASYTTWGLVRGLKVAVPRAANDDYAGIGWSPRGGGAQTTFGNLALKPVLDDSAEAHACPMRFQGQWQDEETGLYYNRHRHYDPLAGQYVSADPIGLEGGVQPQGYVNNPNIWVDVLGLSAQGPTVTQPYGDLRKAGLKDGHHAIQDAAVRDLPGYDSSKAPAIRIDGPSTKKGSPHYRATQAQRQPAGGTYGGEKGVAADAMRAAGLSEGQIDQALKECDQYFNSMGVTDSTPTRIPGNRTPQ
jgi:RHS repeat-associated protein